MGGDVRARGGRSVRGAAVKGLTSATSAYAGNALGTYRQRQQRAAVRVRARARQYAIFFAVNLAGALVQLLCLTACHYGLGLTSPRADTVSGAVAGMALATCLRFWGTRTLVFAAEGRRISWTG
ncbi:GtrA family protein [Streptomyces sp. ISL-100]|nr:GtrA family protein [Streptomyces sp. ISL-100]